MDRQRLDKWLWHARVVRTRTAAAALAASGHVRLNGQRVDSASRSVRPGDVLTVALDRTVRVLKVAGFAERRGAAEAARVLYEDLTQDEDLAPASVRRADTMRADTMRAGMEPVPAARRDPGTGRPTKRERRALARFTGADEP